jgi:hypothetical protein
VSFLSIKIVMLFKIQMIDKRYNSGAKTKFSPNPLNSSDGEAYERTIANSAYVGLFITSAVQRLGAGVAQSDYRLVDRGSIPGTGKELFLLLCVQTCSEAQPASYPI